MVCVYLYGSRARGTERPSSDVDLAVLLDRDPPPSFSGLPLDIESALEHRLGLPVQIVVLNRAPSDLVHRVLRDGHLIIERDRSRRIRFEVRARNEFFDLQRVRDEYRRPRKRGKVSEISR